MRYYIFYTLFFTFFATKNYVTGQSSAPAMCNSSEIQENKTALKAALQVLGKEDFLYKTYACGSSSGYVIQLYMFKKMGLAITSKTGLVDKIEILDTLKLPRYDDGIDVPLSPTLQNIIKLFGLPEQTLTAVATTKMHYYQKGISFIMDSNSDKLLKLIIVADGVCIQNRCGENE